MITQNESLPLPEFEDRLWGELAQLHGNVPLDDNDAGFRKPRNRSRKRRYLVAAATVALAGMGAAVVAVTTNGPDTTEDLTTAPTDEGAPPKEGASPDGEGAAESGSPPDAIVIEEVHRDGQLLTRMWDDEASGSHREIEFQGGKPTAQWGFLRTNGSPIVREWSVNYDTRTYVDREEDLSAELCPPDLEACVGTEPVWDFGTRRADRIRQSMQDGHLVEDGLEVVDGRKLLRLVWTGRTPGVSTEGQDVTWVDPETYRPVKEILAEVTGPDGQTTHETTVTYEYLDRTPENLELLQVEIPEGYTPFE